MHLYNDFLLAMTIHPGQICNTSYGMPYIMVCEHYLLLPSCGVLMSSLHIHETQKDLGRWQIFIYCKKGKNFLEKACGHLRSVQEDAEHDTMRLNV